MKEFEIRPHRGFGPVLLGMHRDEVRSVLGRPTHVQEAHEKWGIQFPDRDDFFDSALQVRYDSDLRVEFIEAAPSAHFSATYQALDVHRTGAERVLKHVEKDAQPDRDDPEFPCNPIFPALDLTVYRGSEDDPIRAIGLGIPGYTRQS